MFARHTSCYDKSPAVIVALEFHLTPNQPVDDSALKFKPVFVCIHKCALIVSSVVAMAAVYYLHISTFVMCVAEQYVFFSGSVI